MSRRSRHALSLVLLLAPAALAAQSHESVADTLHNLSVSGPGEIRSLTETEVCKFCHIPHDAAGPEPLWGHALSQVRQYVTPQLRRGRPGARSAPQPDGSSRLCLSCHDGTVALGEIVGEPRTVQMAGASRLMPGRPGYIGTDLSGSHPVSIVYRESQVTAEGDFSDMSLRLFPSDPDVRLDGAGKVQCTSCHDPHADRYFRPGRVPRFWVKPGVTEVCLACHEPR